jgi:GH15 family glucan-1,4-alpha-glucosidase
MGLISLGASQAQAIEPHQSMTTLTSSNGLGAIVYDATEFKITQFLEHPYQMLNATTTTRNFAYDSYPGIRIGGVGTAGTWFTAITPTVIEYVPGTGIIHTQRAFQGLTLDEYDFQPMALAENASVMLVEVTQTAAPTGPVDVYALFNYWVGSGGSGDMPGQDGESTSYDATHDAYYEWGPSGITMAFGSLTTPSYYGSDSSTGTDNPYGLLSKGANLADDPGTGSTVTETGAVEGFQTSLGTLTQGSSAWVAWATAMSADSDGQGAIVAAQAWFTANGGTPQAVLNAEKAAWAAWVTAAPSGASATEAALDQQSQVILRMGQVTESGTGNGQILASLANTPPPASSTSGNWNIAWVRDMAYSVVALAKSGHYAEAKAALTFYLSASVGGYESYLTGSDSDAGVPYQISVCRYYGDGTEWSDSNSDGPNIEFDGFGLFLWALDQYVTASGDTSFLTTWWASTIKPKVADVLVHLQEPSGLISPDSSIWEVHWDGQQRHFTYTTAAAANGLCSASRLATKAGDSTSSATYLTHGQMARDALTNHLVGPGGALGQSTEAIASGTNWLDASVIEAINWGLIDPTKGTAQATMTAMHTSLLVADGQGFMRDQTGAWYDSQEWVFVDLRSAGAFALGGNSTFSTSLFAWNTGQSADNYDEVSELYDPTTGDYEGSPPMVGFGAGAYIIALTDRGGTVTPTCGAFAPEPGTTVDAGADAGVKHDAGSPHADGGDATVPPHDGGADGHAAVDAGHGKEAGGHGDARAHADSSTSVLRDAASGALRDGAPPSPDSGQAAASSGGGCGCMLARPARSQSPWAFAVPLLGLGVFLRRKRR